MTAEARDALAVALEAAPDDRGDWSYEDEAVAILAALAERGMAVAPTSQAEGLADIRERDAGCELTGEAIDPPEGVVFEDSCIMRAYDRRVLLAEVDRLARQAEAGAALERQEGAWTLCRWEDDEGTGFHFHSEMWMDGLPDRCGRGPTIAAALGDG